MINQNLSELVNKELDTSVAPDSPLIQLAIFLAMYYPTELLKLSNKLLNPKPKKDIDLFDFALDNDIELDNLDLEIPEVELPEI